MSGRKISLGLMFGGSSEEHDVSLMSIRSIWEALDFDQYRVSCIGITRDGRWYMPGEPGEWIRSGIPEQPDERAKRVQLVPGDDGGLLVESSGEYLDLDVIFPVLHGPFGEDGRIQGALDLMGIPYVGSGVAASGASMDKEMMNNLFVAHDLPITDFRVWRSYRIDSCSEEITREVGECLGYPCFVKPAALGSSVGVSRVAAENGLLPALREAASYDDKILVERAVIGARELECSVLGDNSAYVAGPGEVVPGGCFYDYQSKYHDENLQILVPAPVPDDVAELTRDLAKRAFRAVLARGMARVDFFYREETGEVLLNEINTIPGFTSRSMYPILLSNDGITFGRLIDELIELALAQDGGVRCPGRDASL